MPAFTDVEAGPRKSARRHSARAKKSAADLLSTNELYRKLVALRAAVAKEGDETLDLWRDALAGSAFAPGVENLAHYLALRRRDLSELQPALAAFGLSSLGRSDARVLAALDALLATLGRLSGVATAPYPSPAARLEGAAELGAAQERFFGRDADGPRTRIMATLPTEAGTDGAFIRRLVAAGMNCARINCAHDGPEIWKAMIAHVRAAAKSLKRDCRILMDIAGPKCRIEALRLSGKTRFHRGDRFVLVRKLRDAHDSDATVATISFPEIVSALKVGNEAWIDDGKIGARVVSSAGGRAVLEIFSARAKGERLRLEKGVNFPQVQLDLPPLGPSDLEALDFVARHADLVGFSFVQHPSDIAELEHELGKRRKRGPPQPLILKIETLAAVQNLPQLIVSAAATRPVAVMIARGDLAVELGFARLSEIQEEMLWLCDAAHVPVIWATQVLDNLVAEGRPSRAEATDAAMSQRAECVMLNKGPFLVEGVGFLKDILRRMDRHQDKKLARLGRLKSWTRLAIDPA